MIKNHYPGLSDACRKAAAQLLPDLILTARDFGYCLALHGSVARDIDLVAVPWTDKAFAPEDLAEAIRRTAARLSSYAEFNPPDGKPEAQPHGRLGWSIVLPRGPYIDLSVMPPLGEPRRVAWEALGD